MSTKPLIIDGHADILYRMETEGLRFQDTTGQLHLSKDRIAKAGIDLQFFVLFVEPKHDPAAQLKIHLSMIEQFYDEVVAGANFRPVLKKGDLERNLADGATSGLLSIEGGDCIQSDLRILRAMYRLGVRAMGLTWNHGNCIADGCGERVDRGLTAFGREVVGEMNRLGMIVDVAHLGEKGFWDVMEIAQAPVIASHANARAIYDHRRNLYDDQLKALFATGGLVGVTFVPMFVGEGTVSIDDLLRHVDHILKLGGEDHLGIGSDFDGIERTLTDLRHGGDLPNLQERLLREYGETVMRKIMGGNFKRVIDSVLKG
ncbi:dipeptidase [Tumebacillus sp. BK434]|uniref:dipeptidase n=1 Tax=Tumebacillus sp. BK434 TaxID=2512169 RepID=UPI00104A8066|nr:dipeptidase [Tumebacillus sp. BK434]TCP58921.1 dipeptidase [Tumebacillus sp. BK434]